MSLQRDVFGDKRQNWQSGLPRVSRIYKLANGYQSLKFTRLCGTPLFYRLSYKKVNLLDNFTGAILVITFTT